MQGIFNTKMILIIFWELVSLFLITFIARNQAVYSERMNVNRVIFNQEDYWHYLELKHTVSYDDMMYRFWVWPVRKMWPQELQNLMNANG